MGRAEVQKVGVNVIVLGRNGRRLDLAPLLALPGRHVLRPILIIQLERVHTGIGVRDFKLTIIEQS